ncbi:hypothetical protein EW026_g4972 [Hermanssonia centrifuga]|uniref:DUF7223 domain-containing protein n=1 Tax=Hermanssonia centrifuga TaxID=98765 RepID=A0A4S4KFS2_9APHY|nr:hypothetical protein EW026_g4972 [Hermanssonia centrifuga]
MNWAAISPSQRNGNVSLTVQGSTNAGSGANVAARSSETRGLFGNLVSDVENASSFNISKSNEKTISLDKSFTVFDQSLSCPASGASPAFTGEIKVDVEPKVQAVIDFGVAASGSIVPPKLDSFGLFANFNATLEGILNIDATASVCVALCPMSCMMLITNRPQLIRERLPYSKLGFQGLTSLGELNSITTIHYLDIILLRSILTLGPSFNVDVQAMGNFDTDLNMVVDLAYNISNAKLFFPPGQYSSSGDFAPANTNLQLSASPNVASQASVEAHIIPTVQFGLNALDGLAEANVNLDLDTSAKLMLSLQASAKASTSTYGNSSATGSFSGCVDLSSTLAVNAGADGSFFDLFDKSTSVTLFQKTFDLFHKCFGAGSATKMYRVRRTQDSIVRRSGLACLGAGVAQASSIVDEAISAAR